LEKAFRLARKVERKIMATRKSTPHSYKDGSVVCPSIPQPTRFMPQQLEEKREKGLPMKKCGHSFKSCRRSQFKQYCQNLTRKEKSYLNLEQSQKQEPDNYNINQFQSISSSGRTYPLKIPHGRKRILYRSIKNYSTVEDNTFQRRAEC